MKATKNLTKPHTNIPKEEVVVLGEQVNTEYHDHAEGVLWGFLVMSVGFIFLFQSMGIVTEAIWQDIWPMWPVLIILFGFRVVIGNLPIARFLMFVVSLAVFGSFLIYLFGVHAPQLVEWVPESWDKYAAVWEKIKK